jgi:23S rRNA G2069 N7-methylase RlmK/C1962 C5-methylase RlmI
MTQDGLEGGGGLLRVVGEAARLARREVTLLSTSGAAGDHPVSLGYKEGAYLTSLLLHVQ